MAIPNWNFQLTDLTGKVLGEITNASNRKVVLPLNRLPTASFQVPIQHPLAAYFSDANWDGLVKGYRDGILRFIGPVISGGEQFDAQNGQTIAVNAGGAFWRLGFRFLGTTPAGWSFGTASIPYDLGTIANQMLITANTAGYTGIDMGILQSSTTGSAGTFWFKKADEAITELTTGLNSFDFEVAPIEPTNVGQAWPRIGLMNVYTLLGTPKTNAIFEYGTSKANVASYGKQTDRSILCTKGYIQQPAVSDHSGTLTSTDATAEAARGRFEALVDDGGTQWDVLRQALADENVRIRKQARQVVTFEPVMNASPAPFTDYSVGDQVRARINVNNTNILDAMMRVWGITFDIDQNGNEQPQLELVAP